jgi:hypothetical protein
MGKQEKNPKPVGEGGNFGKFFEEIEEKAKIGTLENSND